MKDKRMPKMKCAIIGSGNIGTDLMIKLLKGSDVLELAAVVGIDPASEGLAMARERGVETTHEGIEGLRKLSVYSEIGIAFVLDSSVRNVNMVTCGGQATIPIVAAVSRVSPVHYAEIVASVSSRSAGPGTRANIDEFTRTTAKAIEVVGGARRGRAIIILNPAEPPMIMRDTIFTLTDQVDEDLIRQSVQDMVQTVQSYVPGYRLKQKVQFERFGSNNKVVIPGLGEFEGLKTSVFLEVEGAAHYLPAYAGNLDIMTSAGLATAEKIALTRFAKEQLQ